LTAVATGEDVVPASELAAAIKQINQLQRLLGKKTMEVEILKEAVEYAQSRKWIAHVPLLPSDKEQNISVKMRSPEHYEDPCEDDFPVTTPGCQTMIDSDAILHHANTEVKYDKTGVFTPV
ncbi:hypothetical protein K2D02_004240, partial [Shigella dysenteriae]|nr:hypothetical protein [Shigella dysenteriae]